MRQFTLYVIEALYDICLHLIRIILCCRKLEKKKQTLILLYHVHYKDLPLDKLGAWSKILLYT